jgi:hypothetical protein
MSDGGKIIEGESPNSPSNPQTKVDSVSETITVPFSADISPSRHAKILRQLANILHALLANSMRYAAISDGANLGAGHPVHQQTYAAAMNLDAAAAGLEQGQRKINLAGGPLPPANPSNLIGRA